MSFLREAMGGEKITFGGNYETRWAASEKKAVKVIINHHGKIVKALEDLSMDTSFRPEVRQTAVGLVKQHSNKNVMVIFYFFYDVLDVIETSSLKFQKRYEILVDQCRNIEDMISSLRGYFSASFSRISSIIFSGFGFFHFSFFGFLSCLNAY